MYAVEQRRFNLATEPWITVLHTDGTARDMSLTDLFRDWHTIARISCELPTIDIAVTRLLIAITARAANHTGTPLNTTTHQQWTRNPAPGTQAALDYLNHRHDDFWLFDPVHPFFQTPHATTQTVDVRANPHTWVEHPVTRLLPEVENTNNQRRTLSSRYDTNITALTFAEAARWLVATQSFDKQARTHLHHQSPTGLREHTKPGHLTRGTIVYTQTRTLHQTVLANLPHHPDLPGHGHVGVNDDAPAWERHQHGGPDTLLDLTDKDMAASVYTEATGTRKVLGVCDLYTWQSRRISLITHENRVVAVTKTQGDICSKADQRKFEGMLGWKTHDTPDGPQWVATRLPSGAKAWTGASALLHRPQDVGRILPAAVTQAVRDGQPVTVETTEIEWTDRKSRIHDITTHHLTLPRTLTTEAAHTTRVADAVDAAATDASHIIGVPVTALEAAGQDTLTERLYKAVDRVWPELLNRVAASTGGGSGRRSSRNLYTPDVRDWWLTTVTSAVTSVTERAFDTANRTRFLPRGTMKPLGRTESVLAARLYDIATAPSARTVETPKGSRGHHRTPWRQHGDAIPSHVAGKPFALALRELADERGVAVARRARQVAHTPGRHQAAHLRALTRLMREHGIGFDHKTLDDDLGRIAAGHATEVLRAWGRDLHKPTIDDGKTP